jgi:hypothetical protein
MTLGKRYGKRGRPKVYPSVAERQRAYRRRRLTKHMERVLLQLHDGDMYPLANPRVFRALEHRGLVTQVPGRVYVTFELTFTGAVTARKLMGF